MRIHPLTRPGVLLLLLVTIPATSDAATGGPDNFGYAYIDSDEPDGPVFAWYDLAGAGSAVILGDDDQTSVPIGFEFPFYNQVYGNADIQANGAITFGGGRCSTTTSACPATPRRCARSLCTGTTSTQPPAATCRT